MKNLLLNDKVEEAREVAIKSFYGKPSQEIVELFEERTIDNKKCLCGNSIKSTFLRPMLKYYYQRDICSECYDRQEKEREEQEKEKEEKKEEQRVKYEKELVEKEQKALEEFLKNKDQIIMEIAKQCGIPSKLRNAVVSKPTIGNYFITGNIGTGKSWLAAGLLKNYIANYCPEYLNERYMIRINPKPIFITVPELLLNIRECFNPAKKPKIRYDQRGWDIVEGCETLFGSPSELTEKELINYYTNTPFLILDDLGIEKVSDWTLQTLYLILNRRYEESDERFTIITSNLGLDAISKKLDDRIGSRINGMCKILSLKGKDRRLT